MKPSKSLRSFLLAAGSSLLAISSTSAQTTLTWDTAATAGVQGGTGSWNTTNTNWTNDGGATNVTWDADNSNNDTAIFGAVAGVSTVTLGEAIDIRTLTINSVTSANRYTITGSTLNFSASGTITWNSTNSSNFVDVSSINSAIIGAPAVTGAGTGGNTQFVFAPSSGSQTLGKLGGVSIYRLAGSTTGNSFTGTAATNNNNTKIFVSSGASWTLTGVAYGYEHRIDGTLIISGSGSLQNSARDTVLGSTGILHWNNAGAIRDVNINTSRDRDFRIDGGSIDNTSGAAINSSTHNPQMRWNGNWTFIGSNGALSNLNMGTGDVFITGATRQVTVTNAATTLTVGGAIAGSGFGLTKAGAGTLSLSGSGANTYNGTTTINGGVLALNKTAGVNAIAGAITLGDGAGNDILRLNASNQIADTSVITFNAATGANAGIFRLNNQSETVAGIASTGGGGIIENESGSAATSTLTVNNAANHSYSGIIRNGDGTGTDGTLALTKSGGGTLTLAGASANTYSGTTTVNGGILALNKTAGVNAIAGAITLGDGATTAGNDILRLDASDQIADTSVITFNAATGSNAAIFRLNNQSETVAGIASTGGGGIIENESGSAQTSTLTVNNAAPRSFSGIIRDGDGSGTDGTLALIKSGGATLTLSGTNTYTGGTLVSGGTLLVNNLIDSGTGTGDVTVEDGAILGGNGTIGGAVFLESGATFAPGNSIGSSATGTQTWTGDTFFEFEFSTDGSTGAAGSQWDQLNITGTLDLTNADSVIMQLVSMLDMNNPGPLAQPTAWDPSQDAIWAGFVTTTGGIIDFNAGLFSFNFDDFQNNDIEGVFSVAENGNNLDLIYTSNIIIPEPSRAILFALGLLALLGRRQR